MQIENDRWMWVATTMKYSSRPVVHYYYRISDELLCKGTGRRTECRLKPGNTINCEECITLWIAHRLAYTGDP